MKKYLLVGITTLLLLVLGTQASALESGEALGLCGSLMQAMSEPPATISETSLGDLTADAVRFAAGTDLAVVPAGEFAANIQPGEVTMEDIHLALPGNVQYVSVAITPAEFTQLMEYACSHIQLTESCAIDRKSSASNDFLQISGFTLRYDPNFLPGRRVQEIMINGAECDPESLYTLSLPESYCSAAGLDLSREDTGFTAAEALAAYICNGGAEEAPSGGRIHAIAVRDNDLINTFPVVLVAFAAVIVAVCAKLLIKLRASNESPSRTGL